VPYLTAKTRNQTPQAITTIDALWRLHSWEYWQHLRLMHQNNGKLCKGKLISG
jgi:hypothetical protein